MSAPSSGVGDCKLSPCCGADPDGSLGSVGVDGVPSALRVTEFSRPLWGSTGSLAGSRPSGDDGSA